MNPQAMTGYGEEVEVTLQDKLDEIDAEIATYEEQMAFGEALERLEANPDYQLVILKGYLDAEAERITGLIVGDDPIRRDIMENIVEAGLSIRNFKQFIKYKKLDAKNAPSHLDEAVQFRAHVTSVHDADGNYIGDETGM